MKNILTKTIALIVFVVFLGIVENVEAATMSCYYGSDKAAFTVDVRDGFGLAQAGKVFDYARNNTSSRTSIPVDNWNMSSAYLAYTNYSPYTDIWHTEQCPSYAVLGIKMKKNGSVEKYFVYLSDSLSLTDVTSYARSLRDMSRDIVISIPLKAATSNTVQEGVSKITPRACDCNSGGAYGFAYRGTFKIADNASLQAPSITLSFKSTRATKSPLNWVDKTQTGTRASDPLNALDQLAVTNACPSQMLYVDGNVFFAEDIVSIRSKIASFYRKSTDDVYVASCVEDVNVSIPTPPPYEKPPWVDPSINSGVVTPLSSSMDIVSCGNGFITDVPYVIVRTFSIIYIIFQIIVPIVLVILGSIDFMKAITAQKEDEIKKGQQIFIKRLITAALVFFVFSFLKLAVGIFSEDTSDIVDCMNCFLKGSDYCE